MKIVKILGIVSISLIVILGLIVLFAPSHVELERSISINASPEEIYPYLNDLKEFNKWSPWYDLDPEAKYSFIGPEEGVGSVMEWKSEQDNVGNGKMEIIETVPNQSVTMEMFFGQDDVPAYAKLVMEPDQQSTKVTWSFETEMSGVAKVFGLMMEQMLGPSYEKGLTNLKNTVEAK
ncbi:SRPBCC family protein [Marinigracilibium pacificum]|uniref:SRPBCC family protein n=1 Tax=Marinigracilibium pacificum TaxID=2729599 RepID=A0A848J0B7_9BACT|nr:SRPBCC family protein [Marinigracilibium pacificum]NMM49101.1 SRPBCC family protein [Marinigracilibium pacificum]